MIQPWRTVTSRNQAMCWKLEWVDDDCQSNEGDGQDRVRCGLVKTAKGARGSEGTVDCKSFV